MDLSYDTLRDATSDSLLEGLIEEDIRVRFASNQDQVEGSCSRTVIMFLPIL